MATPVDSRMDEPVTIVSQPARARPPRKGAAGRKGEGRAGDDRLPAGQGRHAARQGEPGHDAGDSADEADGERLDDELEADVAAPGSHRPADADLPRPFEHRG